MQTTKTLKKHSKISYNDKLLNKYIKYSDIIKIKNNNDVLFIKKYSDNKRKTLQQLNSQDFYKLAKFVVAENHKFNYFHNCNNIIHLSNRDIKHVVNFIYKSKDQKKLLCEHLALFSKIGSVINHAKLVSQSKSSDDNSEEILWHYYYDNLIIDKVSYILVFDVVSRNDGENHYRVQRLSLKKK